MVRMLPLIHISRKALAFQKELEETVKQYTPDEASYALDCMLEASEHMESIILWVTQAKRSVADIKRKTPAAPPREQ